MDLEFQVLQNWCVSGGEGGGGGHEKRCFLLKLGSDSKPVRYLLFNVAVSGAKFVLR